MDMMNVYWHSVTQLPLWALVLLSGSLGALVLVVIRLAWRRLTSPSIVLPQTVSLCTLPIVYHWSTCLNSIPLAHLSRQYTIGTFVSTVYHYTQVFQQYTITHKSSNSMPSHTSLPTIYHQAQSFQKFTITHKSSNNIPSHTSLPTVCHHAQSFQKFTIGSCVDPNTLALVLLVRFRHCRHARRVTRPVSRRPSI
jgi:hypothetical protein